MALRRPPLAQAAWMAALVFACLVTGSVAGADPLLAIGAVLALGFALVAFASLTGGVVMILFLSFLAATPLAGPAFSLNKLAGLLVALAWLAQISIDEDARRRILPIAHPMLAYLLVAFLAWAAIGTGWAEDRDAAIADLTRYALMLAFLVIVFTAVRTPRQAWVVAGGILAAGSAAAAYGLAFPAGPAETDDAGRLAGGAIDPNETAAALVVAMVLGVAIAAGHRNRALRLAAVGAIVLCFSAFTLTGSRSGVIALAIALVAALLFPGRRRGQVILVSAMAVAAAVAFYATIAPPEVRDRIATTLPGQDARALGGRETIWQVGWRVAEADPVRGVGVGNFRAASRHYVLEPGRTARTDQVIDTPKVAHNIYLQFLVELGVIGLGLFLAIAASCAGAALRAARRFAQVGRHDLELLARGVLVALAAILTANFFISDQFNNLLWLLLALGPALMGIARAEAATQGTRTI